MLWISWGITMPSSPTSMTVATKIAITTDTILVLLRIVLFSGA